MADRLLGLVGAGRGPSLRTARMKKPILHITGQPSGWSVKAETDSQVFSFSSPGKFALAASNWIQLEASGECRGLICTIHEGK